MNLEKKMHGATTKMDDVEVKVDEAIKLGREAKDGVKQAEEKSVRYKGKWTASRTS